MKLYGNELSRRDVETLAGKLDQVGGLRRMKLSGGPEDGVDVVEVRTGTGLRYHVLASRCLDISLCEFAGAPVSWQSPAGDVHPAYYDDRGAGWLRTAAGGLLMTCGLTQVGSPCIDEGAELGVHGRAHHTPAREVAAEGRWCEDDYEMRIAGVVEEAAIFGERLRLEREITSRLGSGEIAIRDTVRNCGHAETPLMVLYHFNFGWPLLSEATELSFPSGRVVPREDSTPLDGYDRWPAPEPGCAERVYYHEEIATGADGFATATIRNPSFPAAGGDTPLTVRLSWKADTLPELVQWRMPGAGEHVLGIEPANCRVGGRAAERERGALQHLEPGESREFELRLDTTAE